MKKEILKEIIRGFHKTPLPESRKRDITIPHDTGKIITLSGRFFSTKINGNATLLSLSSRV